MFNAKTRRAQRGGNDGEIITAADFLTVIPGFYPAAAFYPVIPDFYPVVGFYPVIPDFYPVIPAKAGIQMAEAKLAIRNQA